MNTLREMALLEEQNRRLLRAKIEAALDSPNPFRAHEIAFGAANEFGSPPFHPDLCADLHGPAPRTVDEAFRGAAKSTLAEQAMTLRASFKCFRYALIIGNTYSAAAQRLASVKSILNTNHVLRRIFGDLQGPVWNEGKITLPNGATLEAIGARQSIRGFKEGDQRPDWVLLDDLEDKEWVKSLETIEANRLWLFRDIIPALANPRTTPVRMIGTPLAENSLLRQLAASKEWKARRFPVRYPDPVSGETVSAWPEKFPLKDIAKLEADYTALGAHREFMQEYMCESESETERVFVSSMLRTEPRIRTWQAIYAMIDPARTVRAGTSAQTGHAVWSWAAGGKLDVWECGGAHLMPDEVVSLAFRVFDQYHPVEIGVELDGLEQWLMQPIREAQSKRGVIPIRGIRAPRGKIDFIKGLQPFFKDGRGVFCLEPGDGPDKFLNAFAQFFSFPRGIIDAPNALAFATMLRSGLPVYSDFAPDCVEVGAIPSAGRVCVLAMNADGSHVTGALVQDQHGGSHVLAEWVEEGQPGDIASGIVREAAIIAPGQLVVCVGPQHINDRYQNYGLNQALHRANVRPRTGGDVLRGRADLGEMLRRRIHGVPGFMIADTCRFTLNGLAAGFAYPAPNNVRAKDPSPGIYRTLIEGIETFIASAAIVDPDAQIGNMKTTPDGRIYRSAMRQ